MQLDLEADIRKSLMESIRSIQRKRGSIEQAILSDDDLISHATGLDSLEMATLMNDIEKKYGVDAYRYFREGGSEKFGTLVEYCTKQVKQRP